MTSLKTSIKTITYLSDTGCLEIQGASLLIDDKQFFIIDIINTFFSYKWNIDWQYCIIALDIFITIIMSVCQVIIWERLGLLLINGMTSDFHW